MKCPVCETEMKPITHRGVEVDYCQNCNGIWFDTKEMEKLSDSIKEFNIVEPRIENLKLEDDITEEQRRCPRCRSIMAKVSMNGEPPIFDYCPNDCGYWFDKDEVKEYIKNNMTTVKKPDEPTMAEILEKTE